MNKKKTMSRLFFSLFILVVSCYLYSLVSVRQDFLSSASSESRIENFLEIQESSIKGQALYNFKVSFDGKEIFSEKAYSVALIRIQTLSDGRERALVEINPEGEGCESMYRLLVLSSKDGEESLDVSSAFGTCVPFSELEMSDAGFRMVSAEWRGVPAYNQLPRLAMKEFSFADGQIIERPLLSLTAQSQGLGSR